MSILSPDDVNAWLEDTKLTVEAPLDAQIENLHEQRVLGVLARRYDVTTWIDGSSTPALIVQLVAMLYAATVYRRQYSEDLTSDPAWPVWLESTANETLALILSGGLNILGPVIEISTGQLSPVFYPNDLSELDDPRAFTMQQVF